MRGYLIDTNVISEYNREQLPHPGVVKWLETTPEVSQYVSVMTLAEIEKGILRKEDGKRRRDLQRWFEEDLPARFAGAFFPLTRRLHRAGLSPISPETQSLRARYPEISPTNASHPQSP